MSHDKAIQDAFKAALPVVVGYIGIGIPCGIVEAQIGLNAWMAFVVSVTFYSGAGQFMIPGLWLAASPASSVVASVSFVNTRQILYSAALSPYVEGAKRWMAFLFSATVTDESFGVNLAKFQEGRWTVGRAALVNLFCMLSWALSNAAGVFVGDAFSIPSAIASFAMTSIFICLLMSQKMNRVNLIVIGATAAGVILCKLVGLSGPAILLGACIGVAAGLGAQTLLKRRGSGA